MQEDLPQEPMLEQMSPADDSADGVAASSDFGPFDRVAVALGALAGLGIAGLSLAQPWFGDDYVNAVAVRRHPGLVGFLRYWYYSWSGRNTSTALIWLSQVYRPLFAILVGISFVLVTWLTVAAALGEVPRPSHRNVALCTLALVTLWFGMPSLGEVSIWLVGSATYLLSFVLMLEFLLPFRFAFGERPAQRTRAREAVLGIPMAALGLALGMSHESAIAGTAVVLLVLLGIGIRRHMVRKLPLHLWAGAVGLVVGGVIQVLSPGTVVRASGLAQNAPGVLARIASFASVIARGFSFAMATVVPWIAVIALLALPMLTRRPAHARPSSGIRWPLVWLAGAAGTMLPFALIPYPGGGRIYAFPFLFTVLAVFSLFASTKQAVLDMIPVRWISVGAIALIAVMLAEIGGSLLVQQRFQAEYANRERLIAEQKARGQLDVVVPKYTVTAHRAVPYDRLTSDPNDWRNQAVAEWHGLRSIRALDPTVTP